MLNMVAGPGLNLSVPGRNEVKSRLMELAASTHQELLASLLSDAKVSIALDCWTSPDQKPFMAITGYWICPEFRYHEVLLGFPPVPGEHTGERLALVVMEVLEKHELSHRILGITTDNATNNGTMFTKLTAMLKEQLEQRNNQMLTFSFDPDFRRLLESQHHLPCLAHVIQLAVTAFLRTLSIQAHNDEPTAEWDDKDHEIKEKGLLRTMEKVC
jgi:hypothetical protein